MTQWMRCILLLFTALVASQNTTVPPCEHCEDEAHGFASLNGGTTGGKGGPIVFANTWAELVSYSAQEGPIIIRVNGMLQADERGYEIPIASNKTIIGVGKESGVMSGGFAVKGTRNIILRNMQVSDTAIAEDWPGKTEDWDGIQVDTGSNIWIDHMTVRIRSTTPNLYFQQHCITTPNVLVQKKNTLSFQLTHTPQFARMNDGLIDLRRDTTYTTVSSTILSMHNKAFGIGWTTNVTARVTINDCFFNSTNQRNPSADNLAMCHMYNNYFRNCSSYGTYARGNTSLLLENSYYEDVFDPVVAGPNASVKASWVKFKDSEGEKVLGVREEEVFDAREYYSYDLRDPWDLPNDIPYFAGPQEDIGS